MKRLILSLSLALAALGCTPYQKQEAARDLSIFKADVRKVATGARLLAGAAVSCSATLSLAAQTGLAALDSGDYWTSVSSLVAMVRCLWDALQVALAASQ